TSSELTLDTVEHGSGEGTPANNDGGSWEPDNSLATLVPFVSTKRTQGFKKRCPLHHKRLLSYTVICIQPSVRGWLQAHLLVQCRLLVGAARQSSTMPPLAVPSQLHHSPEKLRGDKLLAQAASQSRKRVTRAVACDCPLPQRQRK